jgi:multiple sugar transport system substrate-binding protein
MEDSEMISYCQLKISKKEILFLLNALIVISLGLAACAPASQPTLATPVEQSKSTQVASEQKAEPTSASAETKKLTILLPVDWRPVVDSIAPDWEKETGVKLEIVSLAYDEVHDKIVSSAKGGSDIDIIYVDTVWPAEFAKAGFLSPVDNYVTDEMRKGIDKPLFDQLVWDGKLWAFPFNNQSKWLFYNKEILQKGGYTNPPKTLDEMESISRSLMEKGLVKYGTAWGWSQSEGLICDVTSLLNGFGGSWQDDKGNWAFNDTNGKEMLKWMVDSIGPKGWADPASTSMNDRTVLNPFLVGDTAFVFNWAFAWGLIQDPKESKVMDKVGITIIPASEKSGLVSSSVTGGGGWGILKTSKNPDLAAKLLQKLMTRDVQLKALELQQNMPVWTEMYSDSEILKKYPYFKDMGAQFQYAHFRPVLPWYSEWSLQSQVEIQAALTSSKAPEKAIEDLGQWSNAKSQEYSK